MSMTFTKLFSSITASTIWAARDQTRIVWITMLAMADQHGRVWASIPGLANIARVSIEATETALEELAGPDKYSRTTAHEGRRIEAIDGGWRLLNYAKYRAIRDEESIKESKRRYINAKRAAERSTVEGVEQCRTSVERCRANTEADTEADTEKSKTKTARKRAAPAVLVSVDDVIAAGFSAETAAEFIAHKERLKAPLTVRAWADHLSECRKAGWTPLDAAVKVMAKNWRGFEAKYVAEEPRAGPVSFQSAKAAETAKWIKGTSLDRNHDQGGQDGTTFALR